MTTAVPVNALFGSDALTQLVLLLGSDTISQAAEKVAYHSVGRRVAPRDAGMVLHYQGRVVPPKLTVEEAGIEPLGFVYVDYAEPES
jgi:toluene monooxygenase system protein B